MTGLVVILLRLCISWISFTKYLKQCDSGKFPSFWKATSIVLIPKEGKTCIYWIVTEQLVYNRYGARSQISS